MEMVNRVPLMPVDVRCPVGIAEKMTSGERGWPGTRQTGGGIE
jgi:hypothetical protein